MILHDLSSLFLLFILLSQMLNNLSSFIFNDNILHLLRSLRLESRLEIQSEVFKIRRTSYLLNGMLRYEICKG